MVGTFDHGGHDGTFEHAGDQTGGERGRQQRAGREGAAQCLVHEHGVDPPQADPAIGFGKGDAEGAEFGQFAPRGAIEVTGCGEVADGVGGEAIEAEPADHLLQFALVVRGVEVHLTSPEAGRARARR